MSGNKLNLSQDKVSDDLYRLDVEDLTISSSSLIGAIMLNVLLQEFSGGASWLGRIHNTRLFLLEQQSNVHNCFEVSAWNFGVVASIDPKIHGPFLDFPIPDSHQSIIVSGQSLSQQLSGLSNIEVDKIIHMRLPDQAYVYGLTSKSDWYMCTSFTHQYHMDLFVRGQAALIVFDKIANISNQMLGIACQVTKNW